MGLLNGNRSIWPCSHFFAHPPLYPFPEKSTTLTCPSIEIQVPISAPERSESIFLIKKTTTWYTRLAVLFNPKKPNEFLCYHSLINHTNSEANKGTVAFSNKDIRAFGHHANAIGSMESTIGSILNWLAGEEEGGLTSYSSSLMAWTERRYSFGYKPYFSL